MQPPTRSATKHLARWTSLFLAVVMIAFGAAGTAPAGASTASTTRLAAVALPEPSVSAVDFVARINSLRSSRGLPVLTVDLELTARANSWASTMAAQGRIFHSSSLSAGISSNWAKLGENVGVGSEIGPLFQAFVDSPTHLANLVDPAYTRVGVGVVNAGGRMYTAHRFMALAPDPPPPAPAAAPPTAPPLGEATAGVSPPSTAAPTTAAPTTVAPTTAVPATTTTVPPTTTTAPDVESKLGPLERIAELIDR